MDAAYVIIVDAVVSGDTPGSLTVYSLSDLHQQKEFDISPHDFHLFNLLHLHKDSIKGFLIGVEPYEIRFNIGLSRPLNEKWDTILQNVSNTIERLIGTK